MEYLGLETIKGNLKDLKQLKTAIRLSVIMFHNLYFNEGYSISYSEAKSGLKYISTTNIYKHSGLDFKKDPIYLEVIEAQKHKKAHQNLSFYSYVNNKVEFSKDFNIEIKKYKIVKQKPEKTHLPLHSPIYLKKRAEHE